jgi:hypothetical protein
MESSQAPVDWRALVGRFGEPIPKLKRDEKVRLKALLKDPESKKFERGWLLRISLAATVPISVRGYKPEEIREALGVWGAMHFITKLSTVHHEVAASEVLQALDTPAIFQQPRDTLVVLGKLIKPRDKMKGSTTRLNSESSLYVLRIARKLSRPILDTEQLSGREAFRRSLTALVDLVFRTTKSCENPETAVAAFEVAAEVRGRLGVHKLKDALLQQFTKFEYLASLPVQLIPVILTKGCMTDADLISSRIGLIDDERENFRQKVQSLIYEKGVTLPLASRQWAESFLGGPARTQMQHVNIDTDADVNLERMATLLLSAWDAKDEGEKSQHLYKTFSGICRTGFNLVLEGAPGRSASFDPSLHEASGKQIMTGEPVTLLRPWVQWMKGSAIRVIVRALVKPNN